METKFEKIKDQIHKQLEKPVTICVQHFDQEPREYISIFISNRRLCAYIDPGEPGYSIYNHWFDENGKSIKMENELTYKEISNVANQWYGLLKKSNENMKKRGYSIEDVSPFIDGTFIACGVSYEGVGDIDKHPKLIILNQEFNIIYEIPLVEGKGYGEASGAIDCVVYSDGLLCIQFGYIVYILSISV